MTHHFNFAHPCKMTMGSVRPASWGNDAARKAAANRLFLECNFSVDSVSMTGNQRLQCP